MLGIEYPIIQGGMAWVALKIDIFLELKGDESS